MSDLCSCRTFDLGERSSYTDAGGVLHRRERCGLPEAGRKDDQGKLPYHLLPFTGLEKVVAVLAHGAKKYAPDNWRKVPAPQTRYFSAACRHLFAWVRGEQLDPDSGLPHLAHAACCILFLLELDP